MYKGDSSKITVKTSIDVPVEKVWMYWTEPKHITKWNNASSDWHTPFAANDLRAGGKFFSRMEANDRNEGFDFNGIYTEIKLYEVISYILEDGRKVNISFVRKDHGTDIIETFEPENENSPELQKKGWQAILNNFKNYAEENS